MDDLVQRLRDRGSHFVGDDFKMCREAADALEQRTAERDALQAKLDTAEPCAWLWHNHHGAIESCPAGEPGATPVYLAPPDFAALQRRYDALMMECCPDAMTPEQVARWGKR